MNRSYAAMVVILVLAAPALAQPWMDRDRACDTDIGEDIIVRLVKGDLPPAESSGIAFRLPPRPYALRGGAEPPDDPRLPPEGCPGNPVITKGISFPFEPAEVAGIPDATVERMMIYGHDGPVNNQKRHYRQVDKFRGIFGDNACNIVGILEVCRSCARPTDPQSDCFANGKTSGRLEVPAWYRALPGTYDEANDLPFSGHCSWPGSPFPTKTEGRACEFRYRLIEGLAVSYRIDDALIPEEAFIAFDREVRRQILAARAPEHDLPPAMRE